MGNHHSEVFCPARGGDNGDGKHLRNPTAEVATDVDEGTVTVTMPTRAPMATLTISNVRLDLREAPAPVTATFTGNANAFVSGVATVISAIEDALEVESTLVSNPDQGRNGLGDRHD